MAGMSDTGFVPKRASEIIDEIAAELESIQDPDSGEYPFVNASSDSILMQMAGIFAGQLGEAWSALHMAAVQFDPLKNFGAGQSGTVQINAITRNPGAPTIVRMRLSGAAGTVIPAGSLIAAADNSAVFATNADSVLGSSGQVEVSASSTAKGNYAMNLGSVVNIQTPISGWENAENIALLSEGTEEETDTELRVRQQRSTGLTSYRQIEAIYAAVMNVPGVTYARAYQNDVITTDERGIPPKEVAVVAVGGDNREIAAAIFLRLPTGQTGYGDTSETFYDLQGQAYTISFSRPKEVPIYVEIHVTITNRAQFPDNGAELIRRAVVEYAASGGDGNEYGFPPGEKVVRTRLFTPINSVPGHRIESVAIGMAADVLAGDDVDIAWNQVSVWTEDNIIVAVS